MSKKSQSLIKVYQRQGSSSWQYSFTAPDGQRIRKTSKAGSKEQASELAAKHYNEVWRQAKLGEKPRYTWQEAVVEWLNEKPERAFNENYIIHLRWLDQHLGQLRLDEIDRFVIKRLRIEKQQEGVKNRTVNAILQQTRIILKAALEWEWVDKIPTIKLLPEPQRRIRWLSDEEEQRLMVELPSHLQNIVVFALATGLRMSNILQLTWQQVDIAKQMAWVYPDQAKAGKAIGVPLNSDAMNIINRCSGQHTEFVFVFKKQPIKRANQKAWQKALIRADIENFHFHDLRHTWATRHVMNGTPLHVLQELGGWNDISMLRKYAHMDVDHLRKHIENVSSSGTKLAQ